MSSVPPKFIKPCSPVPAKSVPAGDRWLHEPKLDGYRIQIVTQGRQARLYSRRGTDWTKTLGELAEAFSGLPCRSAVLDGELVLTDRRGRPDFRSLHREWRTAGARLSVFVFDLLHRDGADLTALPLVERKRRLVRLMSRTKIPSLHLVESFADGPTLLKWCEKYGLEGVVSKRWGAPYRSGECKAWRKTKTAAWREASKERWRLFEGAG